MVKMLSQYLDIAYVFKAFLFLTSNSIAYLRAEHWTKVPRASLPPGFPSAYPVQQSS